MGINLNSISKALISTTIMRQKSHIRLYDPPCLTWPRRPRGNRSPSATATQQGAHPPPSHCTSSSPDCTQPLARGGHCNSARCQRCATIHVLYGICTRSTGSSRSRSVGPHSLQHHDVPTPRHSHVRDIIPVAAVRPQPPLERDGLPTLHRSTARAQTPTAAVCPHPL